MQVDVLIKKYWNAFSNQKIETTETIVGSASDRQYFRLRLHNNQTIIACYSKNIKENLCFLRYAKILLRLNIRVPKIMYESKNKEVYFLEDLGNLSLLDYKNQIKSDTKIIKLYEQAIIDLINLQTKGHKQIDFKESNTFKKWNKNVILNDLFYFKNYFLDRLKISYHPEKLIENFFSIVEFFENTSIQKKWYRFMYRDFQGRNIMIVENKQLAFIDFQGAMEGPMMYDFVSLVFQAKANLSLRTKQVLIKFYFQQSIFIKKVSVEEFEKMFEYCYLVRLLQVLGAYGLKGLVENKKHFIQSIYPLLNNFKNEKKGFLKTVSKDFLEINTILNAISEPKFIKQFQP